MKFELKQHFQIESARFLPNLPESHPCRRMHGHSFKISLRLVAGLDPNLAWVRDYHEIKKLMTPILSRLDHQILNEIPGLENPTSEVLAKYLFDECKKLIPELTQISISETSDTECSYPVV